VSEKQLKPVQLVTFYLLWAVSGAVCVLDWLVARAAVTAVASAIASSIPKEVQIKRQWFLRWPVAAIDKFALAILGIVAVLVVMALDYVYREAIIKGTIKKRFATVTAIQAGILLLAALGIGVSSMVV